MSEAEKNEALACLGILATTCKSALIALSGLSRSASTTELASVEVLRKDLLSLHRLIHSSTTRLSVSLGKPPPSYPIALTPLKDLADQVGQLVSCTSSFPPGALRKEAVWTAEDTIRALEALARHFETRCRQGKTAGDEYLAKTGAVHDAVEKVEKLSRDELEAVVKAWRGNGESLEDSLKEVKEMMEEGDDGDEFGDDGWGELGEGFGGRLKPEEMERVKKIYPLLRFISLLHGRILSHHILKPRPSAPHSGSHLSSLLALSNSLQPAIDDLASALYAPQDVESIQEAAQVVHQLTLGLDQELNVGNFDGSAEAVREQLEGLQLEKVGGTPRKTLAWFRQCFLQINQIYNGLGIR